MRWIWIDRILELERASRCVAIKNITLAEEVLHDHFPANDHHPAAPVMPNSLILEGFAQTAGILVGHAGDFKEKVILAKVGKAVFLVDARPGDQLRFTATIERIDVRGASTQGVVERIDPVSREPILLAEIDMIFSHIDQNRSGLAFPQHNFVFTDTFMDLLRQSGFAAEIAPNR